MFQSISWQSYWQTLALLSLGYYLAIYLLYYRSDFKIQLRRKSTSEAKPLTVSSLTGNSTSGNPAQPDPFDVDDSSALTHSPAGAEEQIADNCMDELTAFFEEAKRTKWALEELVQVLHGILSKYPSLKSATYKESLSKVIQTQCEHHCSIHLRAEDLVRVWPNG